MLDALRSQNYVAELQPMSSSLLEALTFAEDESLGAGAIANIIGNDNSVTALHNPKVLELVRRLHHGKEHVTDDKRQVLTSHLVRTVRYLMDSKKKDFYIHARRKQFIIRASFVRALVEQDRAVLFGDALSPVYGDFVQDLRQHLKNRGPTRTFAQCIVESLVCAQTTIALLRFKVLKPVAEDLLGFAEFDTQEESVMKVFPVKRALADYVDQLRPVVTQLKYFVQSVDRQQPSLPSAPSAGVLEPIYEPSSSLAAADEASMRSLHSCDTTSPTSDFQDTLESYQGSLAEALLDAQDLMANLNDTMAFTEASLNQMQNKFIKFDLNAEAPGLALTFGAIVTAIFGMNTGDGGADDKPRGSWWLAPGSFLGATFAIIGSCILIMIIIMYAVNRANTHYSKHGALFGNNKFFRDVHSNDYITGLMQDADFAVLLTASSRSHRAGMSSVGGSYASTSTALPSVLTHDLGEAVLPRSVSGMGASYCTDNSNGLLRAQSSRRAPSTAEEFPSSPFLGDRQRKPSLKQRFFGKKAQRQPDISDGICISTRPVSKEGKTNFGP